MKKIFTTLIIILLIGNFAVGQNCYVQLADMSGFDTSPYQSQLEAAACELIQEFPSEVQNQFKVFDFGFYSLNESMQGGFQAVWDRVVQDAVSQSPYYLLFGKQSDRTGVYTKFWLDLKLPTDGKFSCFENDFYNKIEFRVLQKVNTNYASNGNSPYSYSSAEIEGIEELKNWITEIVNCCDPELRYKNNACSLCSWSTQEALEYFSLNGFEQDSVSISSTLPTIDSLCICSTDYNITSLQSSGSNYEVERHTTIDEFSINQTSIGISDLLSELEELASLYGSSDYSFYGAITDNNILCSANETVALKRSVISPSYEDIESKFNTNQIGVWIHIQYDNSVAFLNVKTKGFGGNILEDCNDYPQYCQDLSCIMNKLNTNQSGFFVSEIVNTFCAQTDLDLIYRLGGTSNYGATSILSAVIKSKAVTIKLNPESLFESSKFCDKDSLRYLAAAETILHESVHGILVRAAAQAGSRKAVTFLGYGQRIQQYESQYNELGFWYADHSIILDYYFDKIVSDLRIFNDSYLTKDHYKYRVWSFGYKPTTSNYSCPNITGKTESDLYWNYHVKLKDKTSFPCCQN